MPATKIPSKLKLIRGTYRQDRAPKNEAHPEAAIPEVPEDLSDTAKAEWNRIAPELYHLGLLSRIDRAALAGYCESWARWRDAERKVVETGMVIETKNGNFIENPYYSIAKRERELMHKFLTEFGMTPASRSRIEADPIGGSGVGPVAGSSRWNGLNG